MSDIDYIKQLYHFLEDGKADEYIKLAEDTINLIKNAKLQLKNKAIEKNILFIENFNSPLTNVDNSPKESIPSANVDNSPIHSSPLLEKDNDITNELYKSLSPDINNPIQSFITSKSFLQPLSPPIISHNNSSSIKYNNSDLVFDKLKISIDTIDNNNNNKAASLNFETIPQTPSTIAKNKKLKFADDVVGSDDQIKPLTPSISKELPSNRKKSSVGQSFANFFSVDIYTEPNTPFEIKADSPASTKSNKSFVFAPTPTSKPDQFAIDFKNNYFSGAQSKENYIDEKLLDSPDSDSDQEEINNYITFRSTVGQPPSFTIDPNLITIPWYNITPFGDFRRIWNVIIIIIVIYFSIITPYRVAFDIALDPETNYGFFVVENFLNSLFFVDIILNFLTGYLHSSGIIEYDLNKIALRYLKSWFIIDILSVLPFDNILSALSSGSILLFPRLLRMFRLIYLFRLLRLYKTDTYSKSTHSKSIFSGTFFKILRIYLYVLVVLHLFTCGWIFISHAQYPEPSWLNHYNIVNADKFTIYISSLYFVMTFLTTTGFGDILPTTNSERIFVTLGLACSSTGLAFLIATVTTIFNNAGLMDALFEQKIASITAFMKYRNISKDLATRVIKYYEYAYSQRKMFPFNDDSLLDDLSSSLKLEVALQINHSIVDRVPFFHGRDPRFIRSIINHLKPVIFAPGDFVCVSGDIGDAMYFIKKGALEVLSPDHKKVYKVLKTGAFFGELALIVTSKRTATVRALTNCDLYMLKKVELDKILLDFPEVLSFLKSYAEFAMYKFSKEDEIELKELWHKFSETTRKLTSTAPKELSEHASKSGIDAAINPIRRIDSSNYLKNISTNPPQLARFTKTLSMNIFNTDKASIIGRDPRINTPINERMIEMSKIAKSDESDHDQI